MPCFSRNSSSQQAPFLRWAQAVLPSSYLRFLPPQVLLSYPPFFSPNTYRSRLSAIPLHSGACPSREGLPSLIDVSLRWGKKSLRPLQVGCSSPHGCSPPSWVASLRVDREGSCSYPVWGDGWRLKMKLFHAPKGLLWPLHFLFLARGRVGLGGRHPVFGVTERSGKALDWITVCVHIA